MFHRHDFFETELMGKLDTAGMSQSAAESTSDKMADINTFRTVMDEVSMPGTKTMSHQPEERTSFLPI